MGAHGVEVTPPRLDQDLGLGQAEEGLAVQQFIPELGVEALIEAVLLGLARRDVMPADAGVVGPRQWPAPVG